MQKNIFVLSSVFSQEEVVDLKKLIDSENTAIGEECIIYSCDEEWEKAVEQHKNKGEIKKLIAVGGDGTVNMVAQHVISSNIPLGIIPQGTANILAKMMGIPLDMREALHYVLSSNKTKTIDGLKIENAYYFTHITIGLSSYITKETASSQKKFLGFFAYFAKGLQKILTVPFHRFYLSIDGKLVKKRAVDLVVANIPLFLSTRFTLDNKIALDDDLMDIIILRPRFLKDFVALFFRFLSKKNTTLGEDVFSKFQAKELKVTNHKPLPIHADGEIVGKSPVVIQVASQCLTVVV